MTCANNANSHRTLGYSVRVCISGRYSIHLGLQGSNLAECTKEGVPLEYRTIANEMKDRGYATHMIGRIIK